MIDALDGRSGEREGKGIGKVRERIVWELEENAMGRAGLARGFNLSAVHSG